MFMGDRWSFPHQASAATYVWMPLQVEGTRITIPEYWQCWDINRVKPVDALRNGKTIPTKKMPHGKKKTDGCFQIRKGVYWLFRSKEPILL